MRASTRTPLIFLPATLISAFAPQMLMRLDRSSAAECAELVKP
jgi:hypothetical protein